MKNDILQYALAALLAYFILVIFKVFEFNFSYLLLYVVFATSIYALILKYHKYRIRKKNNKDQLG